MNINGVCISSGADEHGPIYVYQTRTSRILSFNGLVQQSCMKLNDINGLAHAYTQGMMTGLLFIPELRTATIMGLGAGSMAKNLLTSFPTLHIHAIEYRKEVVNVAVKYFHLPENKRLTVHIDDALHYLQHTPSKSDIIFSDLYNEFGMEERQLQTAYLRHCHHALNEHGVLVLNIWREASLSAAALEELLAVEFSAQQLSFEVESGNTIVLAFKDEILALTRREFLEKGRALQQQMNIPLDRYAKLLWARQQHKFGKG